MFRKVRTHTNCYRCYHYYYCIIISSSMDFFFWSLNTEKKYIIQDIPGGNSPKKYRHAPQIAIS